MARQLTGALAQATMEQRTKLRGLGCTALLLVVGVVLGLLSVVDRLLITPIAWRLNDLRGVQTTQQRGEALFAEQAAQLLHGGDFALVGTREESTASAVDDIDRTSPGQQQRQPTQGSVSTNLLSTRPEKMLEDERVATDPITSVVEPPRYGEE